MKKRLGEMSTGVFNGLDYKKLTFDDLSQDFLTDYRVNKKKSLWRAELSVAHLKEFFGGMKACAIETPSIRRYIQHRQAAGAKNATINRELAALRRMFRLAAREDRIPKVPHVPMLEESNVRSGFLEHPQYEALLNALPEYLRPVLKMAYWTGCRKSEILGLRWSQVDFLNRQVTLDAKDTKNKEHRIIPLSDELYETILGLRQSRHGSVRSGDLVFTNKGKPIRYMYDAWREATRKVGLNDLLFHDCRRTAVRNLVRAGVHDKLARTISGHKTRSVFDRYNIVDERDLREAMSKLEHHLRKGLGTIWAQSGPSEAFSEETVTKTSNGGNTVTH